MKYELPALEDTGGGAYRQRLLKGWTPWDPEEAESFCQR